MAQALNQLNYTELHADRDGVVDLQRQVLVYSGNVVISQGSMILRAERVEMRTLPDGSLVAFGLAARVARLYEAA